MAKTCKSCCKSNCHVISYEYVVSSCTCGMDTDIALQQKFCKLNLKLKLSEIGYATLIFLREMAKAFVFTFD